MQVHIHPTIDYLRISEMLKQQKAVCLTRALGT
jgi:hypothetical protein